jgi:hypothetical protein
MTSFRCRSVSKEEKQTTEVKTLKRCYFFCTANGFLRFLLFLFLGSSTVRAEVAICEQDALLSRGFRNHSTGAKSNTILPTCSATQLQAFISDSNSVLGDLAPLPLTAEVTAEKPRPFKLWASAAASTHGYVAPHLLKHTKVS